MLGRARVRALAAAWTVLAVGVACGSFGQGTSGPADGDASAEASESGTAPDADANANDGGKDGPCAECAPTTVAPEIVRPYRLGAAGGQLYWTDFSRDVWTCAVGACVPRILVPDAGATLKSLLATSSVLTGVIDTNCSSTNNRTEGEFVFSLDGGSSLLRGVPCPSFVSARGEALYFTNRGTIGGASNWSITRCDPSGCVDLAGSATALPSPLQLAVATDSFILAGTNAGRLIQWSNTVDASGPTEILPGGETFRDLATDGATLVWLDGIRVRGCTVTQCAATVRTITNDATAQVLAGDATGVYWTSKGSGPGDGKVMWLAPGAPSVTAIANGQVAPAAIALDTSFVYWANDSDALGNPSKGSILRRSKPQ